MKISKCNGDKGRVVQVGPLMVIINGYGFGLEVIFGRLVSVTVWEKKV